MNSLFLTLLYLSIFALAPQAQATVTTSLFDKAHIEAETNSTPLAGKRSRVTKSTTEQETAIPTVALSLEDPKPALIPSLWQTSLLAAVFQARYRGATPNSRLGVYQVEALGPMTHLTLTGQYERPVWGSFFGGVSPHLLVGLHNVEIQTPSNQVLQGRFSSYGYGLGVHLRHRLTARSSAQLLLKESRSILHLSTDETSLGDWTEELSERALEVAVRFQFSSQIFGTLGFKKNLAQEGALESEDTLLTIGAGKTW